MPLVTLTITGQQVDVHESEVAVLRAQGLLAEEKPATAPPKGDVKAPETKEIG